MFNLDPGKLIVIAVVAIILLGPDKLPQFARQVGGAWRSFNEFRHRMESEVRNTMPDLPPTSEIARLARSPSALLNHLSSMSSEGESAEEGSADQVAPADDTAANGASWDGAVVDEAPDGSFQPPFQANGAQGATSTNGAAPEPPAATTPDPGAESFVPGDPTLN
jgi:sec-independent protein translocase protein TatB